MSLTTTIPIINILPPSSLQYTPNPSYKYHVELFGNGIDACWVKIPRNKAVRYKDWEEVGLRHLLGVFQNYWLNEDGVMTKVPDWARAAEYECHLGVDMTQPFEMTVYDANENIVYVHDHGTYEVQVDQDFEGVSAHDSAASYLYSKDEFPVNVRYTIMTHKPFDPKLLVMDSSILFEKLILKDFRYNGANLSPRVLEDYGFDLHQDIKIIYN